MNVRKQLNVRTITGYTFDIDLKGHINIIGGNSSTGKTYLCNTIRTIQRDALSDDRFEDVTIVDRNTKDILHELKSSKCGTVIVDNADMIVTKEIGDYIMGDKYNNYLIFARSGRYNYTVEYDCVGELETEGKTIKAKWFRSY